MAGFFYFGAEFRLALALALTLSKSEASDEDLPASPREAFSETRPENLLALRAAAGSCLRSGPPPKTGPAEAFFRRRDPSAKIAIRAEKVLNACGAA